MKDYWFFLSYARNDSNGDPWIRQFYERLATDVRRAATLPSDLKPEEIGFLDEKGIESGTQWTAELSEALQCSRTFICLYSRSYFKSAWCGKEFRVFADRIQAFLKSQPPGTKMPPLIQAVLWEPPDRLPKPLPKMVEELTLQYTQTDFGDSYNANGLQSLYRLEEKVEIQKFVWPFAEQVAKAGSSYAIPALPHIEPLDRVESAFHPEVAVPQSLPPEGASSILPESVPLPPHFGPEVAWFVYVAGRDQDYISIRDNRISYSETGGALWKPYSPPLEMNKARRLGVIAQAALSGSLFAENLPLTKQIVQHLRTALENNTLALLIVDPWILNLGEIRDAVSAVSMTKLSNCGIIVIWNEQDGESAAKRQQTRVTVNKTFADSIISKEVYWVDSEADLEREITAAIKQVSDKIMERRKLLRPVDTSGGSLPTLSTVSSE